MDALRQKSPLEKAALLEEIRPGKTTSRLLNAAAGIWAEYLHHPFVKGLGDGTLDQEKFRFYMLQDYVYLFDYARVFALGTAKAKDGEDMRYFAQAVKETLDGEMEIHRAYMKRLGITPEEAERTVPSLDNLSYTSYMIRIAYEEGAGEIAAAILSCALSYELIAKELLRANPEADRHEFYGEWVQGYTSQAYHDGNQDLIALTEKLTKDYTEEQLQHLEEIFVNCSRYESLFWDMSWEMRL